MAKQVIFSTDNFNAIIKVCDKAQERSEMVGIIGYPGSGKTIGLEFYQRHNENVVYSVVRKSMTTKEFYINLLQSLGQESTNVNQLSIYIIMNMIALRINEYRGKKLLIIDEAGKFKPQQLEFIHELRDLTKHSLGIVLSGPHYFYSNLRKWKKNSVVGIPELERRIKNYVFLERPKLKEVDYFCKHFGIYQESIIRDIFKECENFGDVINEIENHLYSMSKN